jgi:hypothetical protein
MGSCRTTFEACKAASGGRLRAPDRRLDEKVNR